MILKHKAELAGRVKLQISGGERGTIDYDWFDNMILDQGITYLLTSQYTTNTAAYYCAVGGSSQQVQPTDTGLISPIARTTSPPVGVQYGWDADGEFGFSRYTYMFPRGAAAGNISEISTQATSGNMSTSGFSRALIRNTLGQPVTITVLPDEVLTVTWEFRRWWAIPESHPISVLIDGVPFNTVVSYPSLSDYAKDGVGLGSGGVNPMHWDAISADTAVTTKKLTESQGNPEIANSRLAEPNFRANAVFPYAGGGFRGAYFNPPIPKTDEFTCDITWQLTITRRGE